MRYVAWVLAVMSIVLLAACQSEAAPQSIVQVTTVPEGTLARTVAGQSSITWVEPTGAGKSWQEIPEARTDVETAIKANQQQLASVDYGALSLPEFLTYTKALRLTADDFTGQPLSVEAFGTGQSGERWTLYTWQGPEIPQHPDRPLVHRWVQVYALYDMDAKSLTLLLATIRGEVHE